ncbi:MAG: polysulfide reductase NrfD [Slackia sp.]|nr:polysulfide reductase NrfD [Slackia sp.]
MYGSLVIAYLFLGGASAGGFFVMSIWTLMFPQALRKRSTGSNSTLGHRLAESFATLQARIYPLCLLFLILAMLFLFWDLGSPERVIYILLLPHPTMLTFGTICLFSEALVGALLTAASLFRVRMLDGGILKIITILCCPTSLATMAYTGMFLMSNIGIALWNSWAIIPLFICSSLSCGIALVLLADYFLSGRTLVLRAARPLQKLHLICIVAEALSLALFVYSGLSNPEATRSIEILLSPQMLSMSTIGVLGLGMLLPAGCELFSLAQQESRTIPLSDVLCLMGGLILRYCIITCGVH